MTITTQLALTGRVPSPDGPDDVVAQLTAEIVRAARALREPLELDVNTAADMERQVHEWVGSLAGDVCSGDRTRAAEAGRTVMALLWPGGPVGTAASWWGTPAGRAVCFAIAPAVPCTIV